MKKRTIRKKALRDIAGMLDKIHQDLQDIEQEGLLVDQQITQLTHAFPGFAAWQKMHAKLHALRARVSGHIMYVQDQRSVDSNTWDAGLYGKTQTAAVALES